MKIGILTFHCAHNYGAVLQAYALQQYLKSIGHEVEFIRYEPEYLVKKYKVFPKFGSNDSIASRAKSIAKFLLTLPYRKPRYNAFQSFISTRLRIAEHNVVSVKDIYGYDAYVAGSDQIWNPNLTGSYDPVYCLNIEEQNSLKISYAASLCQSELTDEQSKQVSQFLANFDFISVREKQAIDLLQPLSEKKIYNVVDPTLLGDTSVWQELVLESPVKRRYVLVYYVVYSPNISRIAKEIAKEIGAEVITLVPHPTWRKVEGQNQTASPIEFVNLFKHADFVVTSSFHGTVFATVFNKPFYTIEIDSLPAGSKARMESFLNSIGLESRLINESEIPKYSVLDYDLPNIKISELREKSQEFLKNCF